MVTYKGMAAPLICDFISRDQSRRLYAEGTEFQIGLIEMVGNTGTYLDTPFHRYADGEDLAAVGIERLAGLPAVRVPVSGRLIDADAFEHIDVTGKAVLVHTGWSRHWGTEAYFEGHSCLTGAAADALLARGARLVGIDSYNIDDTAGGERPVHTKLLGAGIPIVEHLTNLDALPLTGFTFTAAPPKIKDFGTFPVRAFATLA